MAPNTRSRKRKADQELLDAENSVKVSPLNTHENLPLRKRDEDDGDEAQPAENRAFKTPASGTMTVFDDEMDEFKVPTKSADESARPAAIVQDSEDGDDDDDEAPEAVSTQQVAAALKQSANATQKAAQEQAAAEKRKRQKRDALFKQQAEGRKRTEEARQSALTEAARRQLEIERPAVQKPVPGGRRRMDRLSVPDVLPLEFLTDDSSEEEQEETRVAGARPRNRTVSSLEKQLGRQKRERQDCVVGSTVYRVTKTGDERLAPRVSKFATRKRDALLKRQRPAVKPKRGFFTS